MDGVGCKFLKAMDTYKDRSLEKTLADSGDFLAGWLGDPGSDWGYGPDSQQQAADLVLALIALREKVLKGVKVAQAVQEIAAINDMLARYTYVLRLGKVSSSGEFHFYERISPGGLIEIIFRLARAGRLDRVRKCVRCGKWFFARNTKKLHHSTDCQQKKYRSTPKFKKHAREYQQTYYHDVLSPRTAKQSWRRKMQPTSKGGKK